MKADGAPPEKVIIAVKLAVLRDATVSAAPYSHQFTRQERLLEQALCWCIQQYYGGAS